MKVIVKGGDVMKAYRRLKKKLHNEGVIQDVMDRKHYRKPSEIKRQKKIEGERRAKKLERERKSRLGM